MRAALRLMPLLAILACNTPGVAPGLDQFTCDGGLCPAPGAIQGELVFTGTARGEAILLLFDTQALPPPDGTGTTALAVARISQAQLFGSATASSVGPFGAPFIFPQVPSGRSYQIRAFLDVAHEFNPIFDFALSPRAGSVVGGFGQIGTNGQPELLPVAVAENQTVTGVNVALTQTLLFDPPSFVIAGGSRSFDTNIDQPVFLTLQATKLTAPDARFANAHFAVELDRDANGNAQSTFADGVIDVFPRVVLQQILAADGTAVAAGQGAIIPCRTLVTPILPAVLQLPVGATPLTLDKLQVLVEPVAVNASTLTPLAAIPAGVYATAVIEKTGQVWTVPNKLGSLTGADFVASQAQTVTFASKETLPSGSISGTVVFQGGATIKSGNLIVQAFLNDPNNPPPPVGPALPVRVDVLRAAQVTATASGFTASYQISGLPAGNYIVEALDDVDHNFSPLDLLQTPTKADLTGAVLDLTTLRPKSIVVGTTAVTGQEVIMTGPVGLDQPVFTIDTTQGAAIIAADSVAPVRFGLVTQPLSFPLGAATAPAFTVSLVRDANGATVDADGDGLPDVWPRVFLVRLDPGDPTLQTQFQDPTTPGRTLTQVIPAAVDPTPFLPALLATPGGAGTILTTQVPVIARPTLIDATNPDAKTRGPLQPGNYKIVVINETGQVWQIPNSSSPAALDPSVVCAAGVAPCPAGRVQTQSQGRSFQVTLPGLIVAGAITGRLTVTGISSFAGAYVFAYNAANPPPPQGTGTPVSADFHSAAEFVSGSVAFTLPDLPLGSYVVAAVVDTRGDFAVSPQLFSAAPSEGTVLAAHAGLVTLTGAAPRVAAANISATAAGAVPARPSFVLLNGANVATSDLSVTFNHTLLRLSVHAQKILDATVVIHPEIDAPVFLVEYRGCDAQGNPEDLDGDGLPDLYPRVLVVKLADSDPTGLTIDPSVTAIPAAVDPSSFALGACTQHNIVRATDLSVVMQPVAVHGTTQEPIPSGRYGVLLMQSTGQTWRLPDELQPALLDPRSAAAVSLGSQSAGLLVTGP
jgi:uncharacterized protein (DUF2141 family)